MNVDLSRMITPAACCQPLDDAGLTPEDAEATAAVQDPAVSYSV